MKSIYSVLSIVMFYLIASCGSSQKREINDLINTVRLKTGQTDTLLISDLWYAPDYDVVFEENPHLNFKYDPQSDHVIISADSAFTGMTLVKFTYNNSPYSFPVKVKQLVKHTFRYKPKAGQVVRVIGSFNTWNRLSEPMTDTDGDGIFEKSFWLDNGRYEYKFYVDTLELIDPANPNKVMNSFGNYNSLLDIEKNDVERELIPNGFHRRGSTVTFKWLYQSENSDTIDVSDVLALLNNKPLPDQQILLENNIISLTIDTKNFSAKNIIRVAVATPEFFTPITRVYLDGSQIAGTDNTFNWNDAIAYSIIIDRFYDGDLSNTKKVDHPELSEKANYFGGDLRGIIKKLDEGYFTDLGINVLWISPVNQNPAEAYREYPAPHRFYSGYHGYWPVDPEEVDTRFGDMSLLQEFVEKAHQKGIRVVLDFVSNHVHELHPYYKQHPDWFGSLELPDGRKNLRFFDEYRLTTWFEPYLPSFDYMGSSEALNTMTDNAVWWLKETNADGLRQDAVKHVPNTFWRMLTRKIKEEIEIPQDREIYQIGETFGSYDMISSYVNNGQLDAQFNFNLYYTALQTILDDAVSFNVLDTEMSKTLDVYGMYHKMGNLMDSHDKVRFMAFADGDFGPGTSEDIGWTNPPQVDRSESYKKAQLYFTYMMTIPGIPFVYYGDEIGMTGAVDPDNRRPMRFGDILTKAEKQMLENVQKIINLRKNNSALRYGDFRSIYADNDIYAFLRADMMQKVLVVLNKSAEDKVIDLKLPVEYNFKSMIPLYGVKRYSLINNILNADVPAYSGVVMLLK